MFTPSRSSPTLGVGVLGLALCLTASAASADGPGLGKPVTEADIAAWDISIEPSGKGLPPGAGTPAQGARSTWRNAPRATVRGQGRGHGGDGGAIAAVGGGEPITDISAATKRIANFWPYSTTVFDYIRRGMPWQQPRSLTDDEVYALTAYILALNKLIGDNDTMNAETLPKVKMPNRDGFIIRFPEAL